MAETPPDRLSVEPNSPHYDEAVLARGVGIRFNGRERTDVLEYAITEGWVRVPAGKSRDRYGNPMTMKIKGTVEAYFDSANAPGQANPAQANAAGAAPKA